MVFGLGQKLGCIKCVFLTMIFRNSTSLGSLVKMVSFTYDVSFLGRPSENYYNDLPNLATILKLKIDQRFVTEPFKNRDF
jgi:hypothetical protein